MPRKKTATPTQASKRERAVKKSRPRARTDLCIHRRSPEEYCSRCDA